MTFRVDSWRDHVAISAAIHDALRKERIEIARMLDREAAEHESAAEELRHDYDHADIAEEAWDHEHDARMLRRIASEIRSRTPTVAEPVEDEIAF